METKYVFSDGTEIVTDILPIYKEEMKLPDFIEVEVFNHQIVEYYANPSEYSSRSFDNPVEIQKILSTAYYLKLNELVKFMAQKCGKLVQGKTPLEINQIFGIKKEMSESEMSEMTN